MNVYMDSFNKRTESEKNRNFSISWFMVKLAFDEMILGLHGSEARTTDRVEMIRDVVKPFHSENGYTYFRGKLSEWEEFDPDPSIFARIGLSIIREEGRVIFVPNERLLPHLSFIRSSRIEINSLYGFYMNTDGPITREALEALVETENTETGEKNP